jgi:hypothetical protein
MFLPGEAAYEFERLSWHREIDPHPAIVAEAARVQDVSAAVRVAREHGLPFAVQSTGHGTLAPTDGGLLLKTSALAGVSVDPERRTATAGPGAVWSDVIAAAAPFGLAPLSGTAAIGVAGYTLGGGIGWLSRRYGFAADSVVRAEVVTADGESVVASAQEEPDLFWALRGGGPNFGVVTSLEFALYPVANVYAGMAFYGIDRARQILSFYRDWAPTEPDEATSAVTVLRMPAAPQLPESLRGRRVVSIRALSLDDGAALGPLLSAAGDPIAGEFGPMEFARTTAITGAAPPPTALAQSFDYVDSVPDRLIDVLLDAQVPVELRHWGGAMARPGPDAGPIGHRDAPFSVVAGAPFANAAERGPVEAAVDGLADRLRPFATGGAFLNFHPDTAGTENAYTATDYRRLAAIKNVWDRDNFFHLGHNIPPVPALLPTP